MKYLYYKYQWICALIALGFLVVSIVYFYEAKHLESISTSEYIVVEQYCHSYQKKSSVHIKYKEKTYKIWIKWNECENYPVDSRINLVYNNKYDYFYRPDRLKGAIAKLKVRCVLFLLTLLPLKYFETRMKR